MCSRQSLITSYVGQSEAGIWTINQSDWLNFVAKKDTEKAKSEAIQTRAREEVKRTGIILRSIGLI